MMMSAPAGLEEVINYADFKEQASVDPVEDESTLEDEPDVEDLQDFLSGNITVNESQIIIFPAGENNNTTRNGCGRNNIHSYVGGIELRYHGRWIDST